MTMRRVFLATTALGMLGLAALPAAAQSPTQVRMLWYSDGNEGEVMADLIARFEQANPDIDVVIDQVSYKQVQESLPVQLESGQGPDMARVTDLKAPAKHWLDLRPHLQNPSYFDESFATYLDWMRPEGSNALPGFMTQLTVTGPFVNKTLFEQAGVELPGEKATWDEWAEAVREVGKATEVPIPLAMDRSGHRFSGPAISMGAKFIGADGQPAVVDEGFRKMAERVVAWHEDGTMDKALWGSVAGTTYRGANEEFGNSQVVMYYSGSWQIGQFATQIKDTFDWWAVPNPCGDVTCTGMPGGSGLVAVKYTQHPKEVARVIEWLAAEDNLREFYERSLFIPAHAGMLETGLKFRSDDPRVVHALDTFSAEATKLSPVAIQLNAYQWSRAIFGAVISRLGQVVAGELDLDGGLERITQDLEKQLAEQAR